MHRLIQENKIILFIIIILISILAAVYLILTQNKKEILYPSLSADAKDITSFKLNLNGNAGDSRLIFYKLPYFLKENPDKSILYNPYDFYINVFLWDHGNKIFSKLKQHEPAGLININNDIGDFNPKFLTIMDFNNDGRDEIFLRKEVLDVNRFQVGTLLRYSVNSGELIELPYSNQEITADDILNVYKNTGKESQFTGEIKNIILSQVKEIGPYKANDIFIKDNIITTTHYTYEEPEIYAGTAGIIPSGPVIYTNWIVRDGRIYVDSRRIVFMNIGLGDEGGE